MVLHTHTRDDNRRQPIRTHRLIHGMTKSQNLRLRIMFYKQTKPFGWTEVIDNGMVER